MTEQPYEAYDRRLREFLLKRLSEREFRANLAKQAVGTTMYDATWGQVVGQLHACCDTVPLAGHAMQMLNLDANPDMVLADIAAKRAILQMQQDSPEPALTEVMRMLAQPYADEPDYDPTWRQ